MPSVNTGLVVVVAVSSWFDRSRRVWTMTYRPKLASFRAPTCRLAGLAERAAAAGGGGTADVATVQPTSGTLTPVIGQAETSSSAATVAATVADNRRMFAAVAKSRGGVVNASSGKAISRRGHEGLGPPAGLQLLPRSRHSTRAPSASRRPAAWRRALINRSDIAL